MYDTSYVNPDTYRNCCEIPHWLCSVFVCVISTIVAFIAGLLAIGMPDVLDKIYNVGGTDTQILVCGTVIAFTLLASDGFLATGIFMDWALFLLIWIILNILVWNVHLIAYLHSVVFYFVDGKREPFGNYRLILLFIGKVIWLFFIVIVGQHWYAVCEDLYTLEHGAHARGLRVMAANYTASNRYRFRHH